MNRGDGVEEDEMTHRVGSSSGENQNFLTTGRPPPPQLGGRKRHADDDTLQRPYTDVPDSAGRMLWDGPHKRILFESEDPDSTASGSETQEARPGWPPDDM